MNVYVQTRMKGEKKAVIMVDPSNRVTSFFFSQPFFCEIFSLLVVFI
jgi:hypothetical protein